MATEGTGSVPERQTGAARVKRGWPEYCRGGIIIDVAPPTRPKVARTARRHGDGARRVPADIRHDGGVTHMSDPAMIEMRPRPASMMANPLHQYLRASAGARSLGINFLDESEVLTPTNEAYHVDQLCGITVVRVRPTNLGRVPARMLRRGVPHPLKGWSRHRQHPGSHPPPASRSWATSASSPSRLRRALRIGQGAAGAGQAGAEQCAAAMFVYYIYSLSYIYAEQELLCAARRTGEWRRQQEGQLHVGPGGNWVHCGSWPTVNALLAGEISYMEWVPFDLLPMVGGKKRYQSPE